MIAPAAAILWSGVVAGLQRNDAADGHLARELERRGRFLGASRSDTACVVPAEGIDGATLSGAHSEILRSLKLRRIAQASAPTAHNGAFSDVGVPHAAGAARMRAGVGRPRRGGTSSRAHASGRASDVRNDFKNYTL